MLAFSRRVLRAVALVAAVAAAFAGGVLTGVLGSRTSAPAPVATAPAARTVVDEAAQRIEEHAARDVDRAELDQAAVHGMLAALGDRWSAYRPSAEASVLAEELDGRYTGVGLWLRETTSGIPEIGNVSLGSPAADAGVLPGDRLIAVDGASTLGAGVSDVATSLRGSAGSTVLLALDGARGIRTVSVTRTEFTRSDVAVQKLSGKIMVVRIAVFSRGVGRSLREALAADPAASTNGVVLDLRGDPGGLLDEAVEVASVFLDSGPVVSLQRRDEPDVTLHAIGVGDSLTPVVVLVDGGTASAAEIVAAALQDRDRAVIVGSRTFGKGSVQEPTRLSDGSALELTVGSYRTPSGRSLDGVGVTPDVAVDQAAAPDVAQRRAVEVLAGLVASLTPTGRG